ncbi:MAG: anthranilate synthase component II [Eggerthellaceae bacterium]|jgi:anthranilate synthase component 2
MIILIDNYDSFSYNLYQMIGALYPHLLVLRNDACSAAEVMAKHPEAIILSPGPGRPRDAGICEELANSTGNVPTLGVCLGHQAICEAAGARIVHAKRLMHGKQSDISIERACPLFRNMPDSIPVGRYHSLSVDAETLPDDFQVVARSEDDGEVMAVQHLQKPLFGVQFHPESILTPQGSAILKNFLDYTQMTRIAIDY